MISFQLLNGAIPSSRKRIISLWFGDVDRIKLQNTPSFTGSAILATVYTVAGNFQYYLVFWSLSQKAIEIWTTQPDKISVSDAPAFEKDLFISLKSRGIELASLSPGSPSFSKSIVRLPIAFKDENETMPAGLFAPPTQSDSPRPALSDDDRALLIHLLSLA
jgi:hypothetical protein